MACVVWACDPSTRGRDREFKFEDAWAKVFFFLYLEEKNQIVTIHLRNKMLHKKTFLSLICERKMETTVMSNDDTLR